MKTRKPYLKLFLSGVASALLYALLYIYEAEVREHFTRSDGFYPALPIIAAFIFSFAHGAFTGYFWEVLGVSARKKH